MSDENKRLYHVMQKVTDDARSETRSQKNRIAEESEKYIDQFRIQTINSEEDRAIMKAQYEATQSLYEKRLNYLEGRILALANKNRALEKRRGLELEGFTNDFRILRAQLRGLERLLVDLKLASLQAEQDHAMDQRAIYGYGGVEDRERAAAGAAGAIVKAGGAAAGGAGGGGGGISKTIGTGALSLHARCLLAQQHFDRFKVMISAAESIVRICLFTHSLCALFVWLLPERAA